MNEFLSFKQDARKIEFAHFYSRAIGIVDNYDYESLQISSPFNDAKAALLEAEELKIQNIKVPLTKEQAALSKKLDKAVSVFLRHTEVKKRQGKISSVDVNYFNEMVESYLRGFSKKNSYQKTGIVNKMLSVINSDAKLIAAAEAEGLTPVIAKITEAYNELDTLYKTRRKAISERERLRTTEIKRNLYFNLRNLFTSIEMAQLANPELSYDGLSRELNQEIMHFNAGSKPHSRNADNVELVMDNAPTDLAV